MNYKKYAVYGLYGFLGFLVIYSSNCNTPLLPSQVTQIAQQVFNSSCYVKSYNAEPEGPGYPYVPFHELQGTVVSSGTVASGASLSTVPFIG